jgi:hypothetical protein
MTAVGRLLTEILVPNLGVCTAEWSWRRTAEA